MNQPEWTCKIDEGSAGLTACCWSPDSRHLLTTADFQLRITLWSLVNKSVSYIKYPKLVQGGLDFTADGCHMALAERREGKDHVSIFDCQKWELLKNFVVDTKDLAGLKWSPNGNVLCVWDSCVTYKILLYAMDGHCISSYSAFSEISEFSLGIKCVSWSPTGQFLAIGSFDEKLRILNNITWRTVAEYSHPSIIEDSNVVVYAEMEQRMPPNLSNLTKLIYPSQSRYEIQESPTHVASVKPDPAKANPKFGVGNIKFSYDNSYIATQNDNMPNSVWIWDVVKLCLSVVLMHSATVKDLQWDPVQPRLALCTNTNKLYIWSPGGCVTVNVPTDPPLNVQRIQWDPAGTALVLTGSSHFCLCYLNSQ